MIMKTIYNSYLLYVEKIPSNEYNLWYSKLTYREKENILSAKIIPPTTKRKDLGFILVKYKKPKFGIEFLLN